MSADRDVDSIVRSWLEEGVTALPDRVLDNVLDRLPATHQRRSWWPARRLHEMNTPIRIAMAAAVVVVVVLIGINLMPRTGDIGGVGGRPVTPVPTVTPGPTPIPTPTATLPQSGEVAPGTYGSDFITFTVPAGWSSFQSWSVLKSGANPPDGMSLNPWRDINTVYGDPCHWKTTKASVGPTVNALVTAFVAQKGAQRVTPIDVTVDGFRGKQVDLMVPPAEAITGCDGGQYKLWTDSIGGDRYVQGPGQHDVLDILDVNGRTLVIHSTFYPATTAADRAELQAMVDSIKIPH
jgi:hypothetical protein